MTTDFDAQEFAHHWVEVWNSHDLDAILSHYGENVVLTSPVAARILNTPSGTVQGKNDLRNYFKLGLDVYPDLHFELLDVMCGVSSVVLCYVNQKGTKTAEFMEFGENGKVLRVVANYSA
jgi:predicted ester cyclase